MWDVLTSTGQRVTDIAHESDARRSIQSMGHTEWLSIYTYRETPNCGPAFAAELRRGREHQSHRWRWFDESSTLTR
jgi:hypothetical protein